MTTRRALLFTLVLIAGTNIVRSTSIPDRFHLLYNVAIGVIAALIAVGAAMSASELGLDRGTVPAGVRWGLGAFAAIAAVLLVVALLPPVRSLLEDDRADISFGSMLWRAVVVIPIGTVLVEELVFRGVLLGLFRRVVPVARAIGITAVVFGLWHVLPVLRGEGAGSHVAEAAGTFVVTTAAGIGFCWLRERSGSLIAPIGAHLATNSVALFAAWLVTTR